MMWKELDPDSDAETQIIDNSTGITVLLVGLVLSGLVLVLSPDSATSRGPHQPIGLCHHTDLVAISRIPNDGKFPWIYYSRPTYLCPGAAEGELGRVNFDFCGQPKNLWVSNSTVYPICGKSYYKEHQYDRRNGMADAPIFMSRERSIEYPRRRRDPLIPGKITTRVTAALFQISMWVLIVYFSSAALDMTSSRGEV